jgi:hypothetical protein
MILYTFNTDLKHLAIGAVSQNLTYRLHKFEGAFAAFTEELLIIALVYSNVESTFSSAGALFCDLSLLSSPSFDPVWSY